MLSLFIKGELPDSLIALTLSRQSTYRRIPPRLLWPVSLALPALLLWVAGCATVPSCPPTLPTLAPGAKDAESIAGRYQDKGAAFSKNGDPLGAVSLTCLLFRPNADPDTQLTNSDFVVLVGPRQDVLEAQSWQGNRQLANSHWQRLTGKSLSAINKAGGNPDIETYRWHKQFLMLFTDVAVLGPGFIPLPVFSAHEQSLQMRKAVDGSLIVFHRNAHTLLFAFAPLSHRQDVWCRFPPASAVPCLP